MTPELEALWASGNMLRLLDHYTEKAARESEARRAANGEGILDHRPLWDNAPEATESTQGGIGE